MKYIIKNFPHTLQDYKNDPSMEALCGPCALKTLHKYYNKDDQKINLNYLKDLCKTSDETGTQFREMNYALKVLNLKKHKVSKLKDIDEFINKNIPVICLVRDIQESDGFHYTIIKGYDKKNNLYITSDSAYGKNKKYTKDQLKEIFNKNYLK